MSSTEAECVLPRPPRRFEKANEGATASALSVALQSSSSSSRAPHSSSSQRSPATRLLTLPTLHTLDRRDGIDTLDRRECIAEVPAAALAFVESAAAAGRDADERAATTLDAPPPLLAVRCAGCEGVAVDLLLLRTAVVAICAAEPEAARRC